MLGRRRADGEPAPRDILPRARGRQDAEAGDARRIADRSRWKPETVDNKACKLEAEHEVKARIARLKRLAAEKATTTRAEVLAGISYTFQAGIARVRGAGDGRQLDYTSVNAVTQLGKTLLDALPKEGGGGG